MPRYTKHYTIQDLTTALTKAQILVPNQDYASLSEYIETHSKFRKDIEKIHADYENIDLDGASCNFPNSCFYTTPKGIVYALAFRGGDWELPVQFIIYLDHTSTLRAYVPELGNTYDNVNNCAFGHEDFELAEETLAIRIGAAINADDYDMEALAKHMNRYDLNLLDFEADIDARIQFK